MSGSWTKVCQKSGGHIASRASPPTLDLGAQSYHNTGFFVVEWGHGNFAPLPRLLRHVENGEKSGKYESISFSGNFWQSVLSRMGASTNELSRRTENFSCFCLEQNEGSPGVRATFPAGAGKYGGREIRRTGRAAGSRKRPGAFPRDSETCFHSVAA